MNPTVTFPGAGLARRLVQSHRVQAAFVAGCATIVLSLAAVYLFLAEASLDDFCRATIHRPGSHAGHMYLNWSGRWLVMWLHGLTTTIVGLDGLGYSLLLAGLATAWLGGFLLAADLIVGAAAKRRERVALALLLFAIFWCGAPNQGEAFYWLTATGEYALPFLLLMAALRLTAALGDERCLWPKAAAIGLIGVLLAGLNELAALPLGGAIACFTLGALWLGRRRIAAASSFALLVAAAGLIVNLAAPGTATRVVFHRAGGDQLGALLEILKPHSAPLVWVGDNRLIALSLLFLALPRFRALRPAWTRLPLPWLVAIPVVTLGAILLEYALASYLLGHPPYGRVRNLLYALLLVGWVATLAAVPARFGLEAAESEAMKAARALTTLIFGLSLVVAPSTIAALRDLPAALRPWKHYNVARQEMISSQIAAGRREIFVTPIPIRPAPLMDAGLSEDQDYFTNRCMAGYLGVDRVRLTPPAPGAPAA